MFDRNEYQKTFAQIHASEQTLTEVLNMTKQTKKHTMSRVTRALVLAAVLSAMLATTAFAYVGFTQYENPIEMLKSFFGGDEYSVSDGKVTTIEDYGQVYDFVDPTTEHIPLDTALAEAEVAPYVSDVGMSISYGDYTLTVDAHLYDSATGCGVLNYRLENPNGVSGYELQNNGELWWPTGEKVYISAFGESYIVKEETSETSLAVAYYYDKVVEEKIELAFYCWIAGDVGEVTEEEAMAFEQQRQIMTLSLNDGGGMKSIELAAGDIIISPISMIVNVEQMDFLSLVTPSGEVMPPRIAQIDRLVLRYDDDTEYIIQNDAEDEIIVNYMSAGVNSTSSEIRYVFNRIIDVEKIAAVIINEVEFTDLA